MRWSLISMTALLGPLACAVAPADGDDVAGETTSDCDSDDGDGDPTCPPGDPSVSFDYDPELFPVTFDFTCTVTSADLDEGLYLQLDCADAPSPIALTITATPKLALAPVLVGDSLRVRYLYADPFWINQYLRIDRVDDNGQRHLLTIVDSETLQLDDPVYELPFALESVSIPCERVFDNCLFIERLALAFMLDGQPNELFDSTHTHIGSETQIWIDTAVDYQDSECTDSPEAWFKVLITSPQ
jgi:hypothetical protein